MKTGIVYDTTAIGTASGRLHRNTEVGHVSARTYLGEPTGEYVVSTPVTLAVALIQDNGPNSVDVWDAVDEMDARCIHRGMPSVRDAVGKVLEVTSFRIGN